MRTTTIYGQLINEFWKTPKAKPRYVRKLLGLGKEWAKYSWICKYRVNRSIKKRRAKLLPKINYEANFIQLSEKPTIEQLYEIQSHQIMTNGLDHRRNTTVDETENRVEDGLNRCNNMTA